MADLFGQARWPGVPAFLDCTYTCSWGITPGVATLTVSPRLIEIAEVGDLVLSDGARAVTIPDCKVIRPSGQRTPQESVTLLIEDHRWRWRFGAISGRYNVPAERTSTVPLVERPLNPAGNPPAPPPVPPPGEEPVWPWTRKDSRQLATLCLLAMGEAQFDVSALDPTATPPTEWDAANPAVALQQIAEAQGCVVVYRPDAGSVLIAKRGEGAELPAGTILGQTGGLDAKVRPSRVVLYGAPVRFQVRFKLEAVGVEFDGRILPIDKLSYRPAGGWLKSGPPRFGNLPQSGLPGKRTNADAIQLASQWVYRAYRITTTAEGAPGRKDFTIPPAKGGRAARRQVRVKRIQQIRLLPVKNTRARDDIGRDALAPAACYGKHIPPLAVKVGEIVAAAYGDTTEETEVRCPFTVDADHQLIVFSRYVYGFGDDGYMPAPIVLECACEVQDPDNNQYVRYARDLRLAGGLGTEPAVIVHDDVRYLVTAEYWHGLTLRRVTDNRRQIAGRSAYYLAGEAARYGTDPEQERTYPGVRPIFPDGAVRQVTWSLGGGNSSNPQTRVSRNAEHALYLPTYEGRRAIEATRLGQLGRADAVKPAQEAYRPYVGPGAVPL